MLTVDQAYQTVAVWFSRCLNVH